MATKKKTDKSATLKTYNSIRGFLVAKAAGKLPRGVKAREAVVDHYEDRAVEFVVGDTVLLSVGVDVVLGDWIKRLGFVHG